MFKKLFCIISFLFASVTLFSEAQKIYTLSHYNWLYTDLEKVMLEAGVSVLSKSYPYTGKEIEYVLSKVNPGNLSKSGQNLYYKILDTVNIKNEKDELNLGFGLELNTETYLQTDKDNNNDYADWIYDYYERKPLLEADVTLGINKFFFAELALPFQKGMDFYRFSEGAESNLSLLWNLDQIDAQFPYLALSAVGGDNWNVMFGRDILDYGVGNTGSFVLSDDASYHDFFKASTFWNKFKYTMTLVNIDPIDVDGLDPYIEYTTVKGTDDEEYTVATATRNKLKLFIDHAFEFRPIDSLSIAIHEVTVRGGGEVTLGWLNPFMIMHNLALPDRKNTIYGNSLLTLSFDYTPSSNLGFYIEGALDQFETPSEAEREEEAKAGDPDAFGFLAGINYQFNREKISTLFNIEFAYTNPHLYRSANSWSIYALTRYYHSVYNDSNDFLAEALGYQYGPDVIVSKISADNTLLNGKLGIYVEYMNIIKGEADLTDKADEGSEAFDKETPSGDVAWIKNIITIKASYNLNDDLTIYSQLNGLFYQNVDNIKDQDLTDFQIVLGASYALY